MPQWDLEYLVRSWWHLWLEFRPKPFFSVFGDQVSPFVHHERTSALNNFKNRRHGLHTLFLCLHLSAAERALP